MFSSLNRDMGLQKNLGNLLNDFVNRSLGDLQNRSTTGKKLFWTAIVIEITNFNNSYGDI
jgi:hypothetical protein